MEFLPTSFRPSLTPCRKLWILCIIIHQMHISIRNQNHLYPHSLLLIRFNICIISVQFSCSVMSDSLRTWTAEWQASLSITNSWSLLKLMSIESVMPSNHLILCRPLLLLVLFTMYYLLSSSPSLCCSRRLLQNQTSSQ